MYRLLFSILSFNLLFSACPDGFYEDSCGNCWMDYCYDYVSHEVFYDLDESECIGDTQTWIIPSESSSDPYFDNFCDNDCPVGFELDDCGNCWMSYCYTFFSPGVDGDPQHSVYYDFSEIECNDLGYNYYEPGHSADPYFNSNCVFDCNGVADGTAIEDCAGICGGTALTDDCGECLSSYCYDYVTHDVSFGACDGPTQMTVMPDDPMNPYWNATCITGDVNLDGTLNVTDVVLVINEILLDGTMSEDFINSADFNADGIVNVVDVVIMVNSILGNVSRFNDASKISILTSLNSISLKADGFVQGIQLTLSHGDDFAIEMSDAYLSEYKTNNGITKLMVVTDGSKSVDDIATVSGEYAVTQIVTSAIDANTDVVVEVVSEFELKVVGPNPFNPTTKLNVFIEEPGHVSVKIYNLVGQVVATLVDGWLDSSPNGHIFNWDASLLPSGIYLVHAVSERNISSQKITLLK